MRAPRRWWVQVPVPLSPPEVAGVLNLRGRIVTLIDMRRRLGLGSREDGQQAMAIGVESRGESYGLLIGGECSVTMTSTVSRASRLFSDRSVRCRSSL